MADPAGPAVTVPVVAVTHTSINVAFPVAAGFRLDPTSLSANGTAPEFVLGGAGIGSVAIDWSEAPVVLADGITVRYRITGAFDVTGDVTATFTHGTWSVIANADETDAAVLDAGTSTVETTLGSVADPVISFVVRELDIQFPGAGPDASPRCVLP